MIAAIIVRNMYASTIATKAWHRNISSEIISSSERRRKEKKERREIKRKKIIFNISPYHGMKEENENKSMKKKAKSEIKA